MCDDVEIFKNLGRSHVSRRYSGNRHSALLTTDNVAHQAALPVSRSRYFLNQRTSRGIAVLSGEGRTYPNRNAIRVDVKLPLTTSSLQHKYKSSATKHSRFGSLAYFIHLPQTSRDFEPVRQHLILNNLTSSWRSMKSKSEPTSSHPQS